MGGIRVEVKVTKRDMQVQFHLDPIKSIAGEQEVGERVGRGEEGGELPWRFSQAGTRPERRGNRLFRWEDSRVAVPSAACGTASCDKGLSVGIPPVREGPHASFS